MMKIVSNILFATTMVLASLSTATADSHIIKASARAFEPAIIYTAPGDSVKFTKMVSHNAVSVEGLIPEGAEHWSGKMGEDIVVNLEMPGIYAYVCVPHIGFGMVGLIVVGDISADTIAAYKQKAMEVLKGPYRRLLGKINKLKPTA